MDGGIGRLVRPRHEDHGAPLQEPDDDRRDLLGRLPLAEDDFREALPQQPMMIELGEAEVLIGEMAKPSENLVQRHLSPPKSEQQLPERPLVHGSLF
jgi:hypothetical protein